MSRWGRRDALASREGRTGNSDVARPWCPRAAAGRLRLPGPVGRRVAAALLAASYLAVGCGLAVPVPRAAPGPAARASGQVTVRAGPTPVGTVLVDGAGMTLYRYSGDSRGVSRCGARCLAQGWTPLAPGSRGVVAGPGVSAAQLAVIRRPGGGRQVTYRGWPLYTFVEDRVAGEAAGQGVRGPRGVWTAARPTSGPAQP